MAKNYCVARGVGKRPFRAWEIQLENTLIVLRAAQARSRCLQSHREIGCKWNLNNRQAVARATEEVVECVCVLGK